ncbi:MAG: hypothetical protein VYC17_02590 [Nitrospinota bacterium]|nr:hypothetical protein [Nitrospinota bacterium]
MKPIERVPVSGHHVLMVIVLNQKLIEVPANILNQVVRIVPKPLDGATSERIVHFCQDGGKFLPVFINYTGDIKLG